MSRIISLIKNLMAKKVVVVEVPKEVVVETTERDAEFLQKHTGAQDNVIYG